MHLVVCSLFVGKDVRMYVRMREMYVMYGISVMSVRLVCLSVMLVGNVCNNFLPAPLSKAVCLYACMHARVFTYVCVCMCDRVFVCLQGMHLQLSGWHCYYGALLG